MSKVQTAGRIAAAAWLAVCVNVGSQRIGEIIGEKVAEGVMKARRRREKRWEILDQVKGNRLLLLHSLKHPEVQDKVSTTVLRGAVWSLSQNPDRMSLGQLKKYQEELKVLLDIVLPTARLCLMGEQDA